jgi:hypothetical protein
VSDRVLRMRDWEISGTGGFLSSLK